MDEIEFSIFLLKCITYRIKLAQDRVQSGILLTQKYSFGFYKRRGISYSQVMLLTFQECFCSIKLVLCNSLNSIHFLFKVYRFFVYLMTICQPHWLVEWKDL
jgi:hypothetical protein